MQDLGDILLLVFCTGIVRDCHRENQRTIAIERSDSSGTTMVYFYESTLYQ